MGEPAAVSVTPSPMQRQVASLVFLHVAILTVFLPWAFGGQAPWAREFALAWGTLGMLLFAAASATWRGPDPTRGRHPALAVLWPLWVFDLLVIASCFNPGMREMPVAGQVSFVVADPVAWLPSAAIPRLAGRELWLFNGLVLSACNVLLVATRRRHLRTLLLIAGANAVVLAVFGTFQKLTGAEGLWFGAVPSPNARFFATFIYHNHWAAFALLGLSAGLALLFHFRGEEARDGRHSRLWLGLVALLLLAASIPLSSSRSGTVLAALLLGGSLVHLLARVARQRRREGRSAAGPVAAIALAAALALGAIAWLGHEVIAQRSRLTVQQLAQFEREGSLSSRLVLYRDTWTMAAAKPVFGWGLESYAHVFRIFNTQRAVETWVWVPYYAEAHSDWLQSLAETGFVGTGLLGLLGWLPWRGRLRRARGSVVPRYLLAGLGLILVYAAVEFPFANPAVTFLFWLALFLGARHLELDAAAAPARTR